MKGVFFLSNLLFTCLLPADGYISEYLRDEYTSSQTLSVIISFKGDTEYVIKHIESKCFENDDIKVVEMIRELKVFSYKHQKNAIEILEAHDVYFESLWIANKIAVPECTQALATMINDLEGIDEIREPREIEMFPSIAEDSPPTWGVDRINAPKAWALGCNGTGVVVSSIDSGVNYKHKDLFPNYRGGGYYSWYDPYNKTEEPIDLSGHGTHTMGTIAGLNGIGVAPGAKWITCRGCYARSCSEYALLKCGEWILCPTYTDGTYPDCSMRPRICSNSWGGGQGDKFYNPVIQAWHVANIVPVFAIGNNGTSTTCGTANSPGDQPDVISVGATTFTSGIARFSSRGPSVEGRQKPEISAPGDGIRSCFIGGPNSYAILRGTSMATPHVAGAAAILVGCNEKYLTFQQLLAAIKMTAYEPNLTGVNCVNASDPWPNNSYGWGIVDVKRSLAVLEGITYEEYNPCHKKYY